MAHVPCLFNLSNQLGPATPYKENEIQGFLRVMVVMLEITIAFNAH